MYKPTLEVTTRCVYSVQHSSCKLPSRSLPSPLSFSLFLPYLLDVQGLCHLLQAVHPRHLGEGVEVDGRVVQENYLGQERVLGYVVAVAASEEPRHDSRDL